MTDATDRTAEIAAYQLAVERHLSDLPEPIRDDLLSGLDAHLAEVAADLEPGLSLGDLLGSPEAYARELRETVEIRKVSKTKQVRQRLGARLAPLRRWGRTAADKFATSAGIGEVEGFWRSLTPAWWILRGVLAAGVFIILFVGELRFMSPGSLAALILLGTITLAFVWLSLRIGVRTAEWSRRRKRIVLVSGLLLVAITLINGSSVWNAWRLGQPVESVHYIDDGRWSHVEDVYVYDQDGNMIEGAYLFDQDGNPIEMGDPAFCEEWPGHEDDVESPPDNWIDQYDYRYPLCGTGSEEPPTPEGDPATQLEPTAEPGTETPTAEASSETPAPGEEPTETPAPEGEPTETPTAEAPTTGPADGE